MSAQPTVSYTLDPKQAILAGASTRITETGKYVGIFTRAEAFTTRDGARGVEFSFKDNNGASAEFLTLYTHHADGKEAYGIAVLYAIMTCLRVKKIVARSGPIEKYDIATRTRGVFTVDLLPDLMNKPIGVLLQHEFYTNKQNQPRERMGIFMPFEANTNLIAAEILEGVAQPEKLAKAVSTLRDRVQAPRNGAAAAAPATTTAAAGGSGFDGFDDDIPF